MTFLDVHQIRKIDFMKHKFFWHSLNAKNKVVNALSSFEPCHGKACLPGISTALSSSQPAQSGRLANVLEISDLDTGGITLSKKKTTMVLIICSV